MKYSEFITRVDNKIRDVEAWPDAGSETQEQVRLSWVAALAVASDLPLSSLPGTLFSDAELTGGTNIRGQLDRYTLPTTVFRYRDDLGLAEIRLDDISKQFQEAQDLVSIHSAAFNPLYKGAHLFAFDLPNRRLYVHAATTVELRHLTEFTEPDVGDIGTAEYPLDGNQSERAASLVAFHVSGETIRDTAAAQFQDILQDVYGRPQPQVQEQSETG